MLEVPSSERAQLDFALELTKNCCVSVGQRSSYYNMLNTIAETGRSTGPKSLINLMNNHLARTAAHLFSPVELKFNLDFENKYPKPFLERAAVAANVLTRQWDRTNTDLLFGQGVFTALKYGACFVKQWAQVGDEDSAPTYYQKLVMPWQMGFFNECETELDRQPAMVETSRITLPEVWRRIYHLPNSRKLYDRIKAQSSSGQAPMAPENFAHQILSASQLSTSATQSSASQPGGILQIGQDPNFTLIGPQIDVPTVECREIWVQDAKDYTTIILIEPDILIAPYGAKSNLFVKNSKKHPYDLIQPNETTNWIWGRSELVDLIEAQAWLAMTCDDARRLGALQVDKFLGFVGETGMTDELYAQARFSGFVNMQQGGTIQDLTPKFPPELLPLIKFQIEMINVMGSFPEIMQGKGEAGVRAGVHANTLLKTASPTLRDRSLIVERQCANTADKTLFLMEAKDSRFYWTKADTVEDVEKTKFLLSDLPDDWRVTVDSHSSSPIFANENANLIFTSQSRGIVDEEYVVDNMPYPNKEAAKQGIRERRQQKAEFMQKLMQENPEIADKVLTKQLTGGKK